MLFFNALMLTVAGLASAQIELLRNNIDYRNVNTIPRPMLHQDARQSWINSGSLLDGAQYSPLMYGDNGYRGGLIVGRGVGFGGSRIHLLDDHHRAPLYGRSFGMLGARRHYAGLYGNDARNLFSGRLMRETEGATIGGKNIDDESPKPYAFAYDTTDEYNNKMGRQEQQDESGRVTGSYSYMDANGIMRRVDYVADEQGFRADVKTNEPGTVSSVIGAGIIQSAAPTPSEAVAVAAAEAPKHISGLPGAGLAIPRSGTVLDKLRLEKTPVVVRSLNDERKLELASGLRGVQLADGNVLSLAQSKGFQVNPNFMRFALPSIAQSFGPASLVKIADPNVGEQFLKAAAAAAAAAAA